MLKCLIFDVDGTLADTDEVIFYTWKELIEIYKPKGFKIDKKRILGYSGPPLKESLKDMFSEYDLSFIENEYNIRTNKYYDYYLKGFDNEKEVIKTLKDKGLILTVATSKNKEKTIDTLKKLGIYKYFDYIVSSSDVKNLKPNPESYFKILERFNLKNDEVISIGDTFYDYATSKNASIKCIILTLLKRNLKSINNDCIFIKDYNELLKEILKYV